MDSTMNRKGVSSLQMRVAMDEGAEVKVYIQYDSDGQWRLVKTLKATKKQSFSFPVKLRRCDHYRLKIEGAGFWQLYGMAKEFYIGSGRH